MKKSKTKFLMLGVIACILAIISVWVFSWLGSLVPRWADFPCFITAIVLFLFLALLSCTGFSLYFEDKD